MVRYELYNQYKGDVIKQVLKESEKVFFAH